MSKRGGRRAGTCGAKRDTTRPLMMIPYRRLGAYVIDWAASGVLIGLPEVFVFALVTHSSDMFSNMYVFSSMGYSPVYAYACCTLSLMLFLSYYVWIPFKVWPGQTLGKHVLGLSCERRGGGEMTLGTYVLRAVVGLLVIEGVSTVMTRYLVQTLTLLTGFYMESVITPVAYLLTMVSGILVVCTRRHLAIHDYIAGTRVVGLPRG